MAGLKGLDASSVAARQGTVDEKALKEFIGAAPLQAQAEEKPVADKPGKKKPPAGPKFARTNFSLSAKVNKQIDQLSLVPRTFKVNRSDVVKAGIVALKSMPRAQLIELLANVVGADSDEESEQGE